MGVHHNISYTLHRSVEMILKHLICLGYLLSSVSCSPGIEALAQAGSIIAEKSADYVVDLLCGCGCRFVEQKTCVQEYKDECKIQYKDVCHVEKQKVCRTEYKEVCKPA